MRTWLFLSFSVFPLIIAALVVSYRRFVEVFFPDTHAGKKYREWRLTAPPWRQR